MSSHTAAVLGKVGLPAPLRELAARTWDVIVVGAGHNGLACAAYLARAGKRVLVLEARERVGGACTVEEPFPGVYMSPCAYLAGLLHPLVVAELNLAERGFQWTPAVNGLFVPFLDGSSIQLWDDDAACEEEVRRFAPGDVEGWRAMNEVIRRLRDALRPEGDRDVWIGDAPTREQVDERLGSDDEARHLLYDWSMAEFVERYLRDERLQSAYLGQGVIGTNASPFDPGTASIRFHHASGRLGGALSSLAAFSDTRVIAPACHDTASAIASIPDTADDWAYISSGTWALVGTVLDSPVNTPQARAENFTNLRGVDGTFCFHKNVNGMWLLGQCMEAWNKQITLTDGDEGKPLTVESLVYAAETFASRGYTLDVDDADLLLPGHMPGRINAQLRRRSLPEFDPTPAHAAELASFLFHSLAARYAEVLRSVAVLTAKHLRRLYVMGGGSQNELLNRLTAEATGLQVIRAGAECSTVGNFAVQLATLEGTTDSTTRPTSAWATILNPL